MCGICLRHIDNSTECPATDKIAALPGCFAGLSPNAMCEGDGECGTDRTANNCAWHDLYVRVACIPPTLGRPEAVSGNGVPWDVALPLAGGAIVAVVAAGALVRRWWRSRRGDEARKTGATTRRVGSTSRGMPAEVSSTENAKGEAFVAHVHDQL